MRRGKMNLENAKLILPWEKKNTQTNKQTNNKRNVILLRCYFSQTVRLNEYKYVQ